MATYNDISVTDYLYHFAEASTRYQLIDVRETDEYESGHLPRAVHIPLGDILARAEEISKDLPVVLVCARGGRSGMAAEQLASVGFTDLYNIQGGTIAWAEDGHPLEK
jgi:rhodanese-related sulfurtransferase